MGRGGSEYMNTRSRLIYEYLSIEQKMEVLKNLKTDYEELQKIYVREGNDYPKIVRQVITDTLDRWHFEIEDLEDDVDEEVNAI